MVDAFTRHLIDRYGAQIDAAGRPGLPLFFTEWSTSYNPRDPIHDGYLGAAYVLGKLRRTEGVAQGMSYWTFSDLFEEPGPQTKPLEGGFGLMTPRGVRKPPWFAYRYLADLGDREVPTGDAQSLAAIKGRTIQLLAWRDVVPDQPMSNRPFFTTIRVPARAAPLDTRIGGLKPGSYRVTVRRTGFRQNDAYTAYLEMGRPAAPTGAQLAQLQAATRDLPATSTLQVRADGKATIDLPMRDHDVAMMELTPA